jgi:hypothetical protein
VIAIHDGYVACAVVGNDDTGIVVDGVRPHTFEVGDINIDGGTGATADRGAD